MNLKNEIRVISQEELVESGCNNISEIINVCEYAFMEYNKNKVIFPDKTSVVFNEEEQSRINCLPAGFISDKIYGMKWISVFPKNPSVRNVPNQSAVILLSELEKGFPVALLEGTMATYLRTASVGAIASKYCSKKNSEEIGFIGTGEIAKAHLIAFLEVNPNIKVCKLSSASNESIELFIKQMSKKFPNLNIISCGQDYKKSVENSDIIITAISGQEPILKADWVKDGAFYCHVAGLEDEFAVAQKANKIICDDWNVVKHRTQTISQMYKQGLLKDEDIYCNLSELISANKKGRENEKEFIYFNSVGLSFIDIAVANWMYKKAVSANKGKVITLKETSIFD